MTKVFNITKDDRWALGEDKQVKINVDDGASSPSPVDCSSFALTYELRPSRGEAAEFTKTKAGGQIATANKIGSDDQVVVTVLAADTSGLDASRRYFQQLRRTDAGFVTVMAEGYVEFLEGGF